MPPRVLGFRPIRALIDIATDWLTRFVAVQGIDRAMAIGAQAYTALIPLLIVYASLLIPASILFEAYLSFLGLGVPDNQPSWGNMVSDSLENFDVVWWLWFFPGLFLLFTVLAFNLLGDGLRDALDPRVDR